MSARGGLALKGGNLFPYEMGSYIPYLTREMAPVFGVNDTRVIGKVEEMMICFDAAVRKVDLATDSGDVNPAKLHDGTLALVRGVALAGNMLPQGTAFWQHWQRYFTEASEAELALQRKYRGAFTAWTPEDVDRLGAKNAIMKIAPALYAAMSNRWDLLQPMENFVQAASVGVQLMDDILDAPEDLAAKYFSYPLFLAHQTTGSEDIHSLDHALFNGGGGLQVLDTIDQYMQQCSAILMRSKATALMNTLDQVRVSTHQVRAFLQETDKPTDFAVVRKRLEDALHPILLYF